jgi:hypothetical protein
MNIGYRLSPSFPNPGAVWILTGEDIDFRQAGGLVLCQL